MAKNEKNGAAEENTQKHVQVRTQYVKDLSFESPNSPAVFTNQQGKPNIDVNIDLKANIIAGSDYEVTIRAEVKATAEETTLFLADISYAGIFTLHNIPEEEREAILMIYCPGLLFPFARRAISDVTRDGGFPPLMLDPIDFATLFQRRKEQQQKAG